MNPRIRVLLFFAVLTIGTASTVHAQWKSAPGDWPGFRGPDRTNLSPETGLLPQWPAGGPKLVWKSTGLGGGYSTPSLAAGRIYLMGTKGQAEAGRSKGKGGRPKGGGGMPETVVCLDANGGKPRWATEVGSTAGGYPGPRCTPTVDGDRVYAISSNGTLVCLKADDGGIVWKKEFRRDYGGQAGNWAYAESPLIDGDVLVCTPGGSTATLVALAKTSGKEIWRSQVALKAKEGQKRGYATAAYASAVVAEFDGVKQYVQFLDGGVVGVAAKEGKLLWHYDAPASPTANCSMPIVTDGAVIAAAAYNTGGGRARIVRAGNGFKAEEVWFDKPLQNHHGGLVLVGEHLYGTNNNSLLCVNAKTGEVVWQNRGVGKGSVAFADGRLYYRGEDGTMALVDASPAGYRERGRFAQPDRSSQRAWPYPVIAGGKLYLRDWDTLLCYDVKGVN
ncbi:MAG: PQQ-binding-like beta-propeller repeat protein [Gemmataceae bacterium]